MSATNVHSQPKKGLAVPFRGLFASLCTCALVLAFGNDVANAEVAGHAGGLRPVVQYARDVKQRNHHVHADEDGIVTIPITTLYSVSTPMITDTSSSASVIVPELSSEAPACTPSVITKFVTVTQSSSSSSVIEPESTSLEVELSTVTEIHTAVSTIVKTLTNSAAVTVIETPTEAASDKDGLSYPPPPPATPTTTTTTWATVTGGEPVTSTTYVVVTQVSSATTIGSGINATVIIYPPGGGEPSGEPSGEPEPSATPGPIVVGAASELRFGSSSIVYTAIAVVAVVMCFF